MYDEVPKSLLVLPSIVTWSALTVPLPAHQLIDAPTSSRGLLGQSTVTFTAWRPLPEYVGWDVA